MSELLIDNSLASARGVNGPLTMPNPSVKLRSRGSHSSGEFEPPRETPVFESCASSQPTTQHERIAASAFRPDKNSVLTFLVAVFKHDLDFKVRRLPPEYWRDAGQLAAAFQAELLDLITPIAREVLLNQTQMLYARNVMAGTYHLDIHPHGTIYSRCDQAQILAVATYLNSLR